MVAIPDTAQLEEMFLVMAELEAMAAALAALAMTPEERRGLERQHAAIAAMVRQADVAAYRAANGPSTTCSIWARIMAILANSPPPRAGASPLSAPRSWRRRTGCGDRMPNMGRVVIAIQRGDAAAAAAMIRTHIGLTGQTWAAMAEALPRPNPSLWLALSATRAWA